MSDNTNSIRAETLSALATFAEREGRALRALHRDAALRGVVLDALASRGVVLPRGREPLPYEGSYCRNRLGAPMRKQLVGELLDAALDGSPEAVVDALSAAFASHLGGMGCAKGAHAVLAAAAGGCVGTDAYHAAKRIAAALVAEWHCAAEIDPHWYAGPPDEPGLRDSIVVSLTVLGVVLYEVRLSVTR